MITKINQFGSGPYFQIRHYEQGVWKHDCYVDGFKEAVKRMNFLCQQYEYKEDEVQLVKITYYENIIDENPF